MNVDEKIQRIEEEDWQMWLNFLEARGVEIETEQSEKYSKNDGFFTTKDGKKYAVEIKQRYSIYPTLYLEVIKYNNLMKLIENGEVKDAVYFCYYGDECYWVWLIHDRVDRFPIITQPMNKNTTKSTKVKVPKQVFDIPLKEYNYLKIN